VPETVAILGDPARAFLNCPETICIWRNLSLSELIQNDKDASIKGALIVETSERTVGASNRPPINHSPPGDVARPRIERAAQDARSAHNASGAEDQYPRGKTDQGAA
jgi:hypothetical protein